MKTKIISIVFFLLSIISFAQTTTKSIKIGNQVWMTENLNVSKFRNGDIIPEVRTAEDWQKAVNERKPACCFYNNNSENGKKYGRLYNWYAVSDKRGLAPNGYHIPTQTEFETLCKAVGSNSNILKAHGQGKGAGAGKNDSGFSALLAGIRYLNGGFNDLEATAYFWSASDGTAATAYYIALYYSDGSIYYRNIYKGLGFSVRCVKD
jgi:uncharacterized protein (TIGR02145 family)